MPVSSCVMFLMPKQPGKEKTKDKLTLLWIILTQFATHLGPVPAANTFDLSQLSIRPNIRTFGLGNIDIFVNKLVFP